MRLNHSRMVVFALAGMLALALNACKKEVQVSTEKTSVAGLKKAFPGAKIDTNQSATATATVPQLAPNEKATPEFYVGVAASAMQNNETVAAFKLITMVQKQPDLTADQHMALHDVMRALQQDLIKRAEKGDKAAMEQIRQLNSRPP